MEQDVFDYILTEETAFKSTKVPIRENYEWSMFEHISLTILYINSKYKNSQDEPFKNIIRPIVSLQHRATGFDVKDIVLFINDSVKYFKSFLVKKYHEIWARLNHIDVFIDEMVASFVDFGGALVKDVDEVKPEVVPLQRLAFCDQTDILAGPICEKHFYSPDQLKEMESNHWGDSEYGATATIDQVINLSKKQKGDVKNKQSKTPGKFIEIYELHGMFPKWWLGEEEFYGEEDAPENQYERQLHIVAFYQNDKKEKKGICLFKSKEKKSPYKFVKRYPSFSYGRALGIGGAEELFEPQVWLNYDLIRIRQMLDAASKIILQSSDSGVRARHPSGLSALENLEIITTADGKTISQVDTFPRNVALFEKSLADWENHARQAGGATESIMGESPSSGTPFKLQELITNQSQSYHEEHKGALAIFLDELYQDWFIPHIAREITKGQEFLAELDLDELQQIAETLVVNEVNKVVKEKILNGEMINLEEIDAYKTQVMESFMKSGNKKFIEILKDELKDAPLSVEVNIAGKQAYLAKFTDKLVNILRQFFATPQMWDDPRAAKIMNQILESSGLSPINFYVPPKQLPQLNQQPMVAQQNQPAMAIQ